MLSTAPVQPPHTTQQSLLLRACLNGVHHCRPGSGSWSKGFQLRLCGQCVIWVSQQSTLATGCMPKELECRSQQTREGTWKAQGAHIESLRYVAVCARGVPPHVALEQHSVALVVLHARHKEPAPPARRSLGTRPHSSLHRRRADTGCALLPCPKSQAVAKSRRESQGVAQSCKEPARSASCSSHAILH